MNANISSEREPFIRSSVRSGRYRSTDAVVDEALRLLEQRDGQRIDQEPTVETLLIEGLDSGPAEPMTGADWDGIEREGRSAIAARKAGPSR